MGYFLSIKSLFFERIIGELPEHKRRFLIINVPDNKEDNILIFTPKEKKFIFNKYKLSNKKGAQQVPIVSAPLIKILEEHLKRHPYQKYLLM